MAGALIGLDMGSHTIKAAEVVATHDGCRLNRVAVAPTPPNTIINGNIVDPEPLGRAVADMLRAEGFTTRRVVSSLGGQTALVVRVTEVPRMPRKELRTAMKWDVERHIPFPATDIVMDFDIIEPTNADPSSPNMEILLAVAQRGLVRNHMRVLEIAKLEPVAIDIEQLASIRALMEAKTNGAHRERCVAIINIGSSLTDISIIQDGFLRFPRAIPLAGETFTTAIGQSFVVEAQEAENLKRQLATLALEGLPAEEEGLEFVPRRTAATALPYDLVAGEEVTISLVSPTDEAAIPYSPLEHTVELGGPAELLPEPAAARFTETVEGPVFGEPFLPAAEEVTGEVVAPPPPPAKPRAPEAEPTVGEMGGLTAEEETIFGAPTIGMGMIPLGEYEPVVAPDLSDPHAARQQLSATLVPVVAELAAEIRRSIEYYGTRHEDTEVERIILIGGSAKMEHMSEFIERELGIQTELGDPFAGMVFDERRYTREHLADIAPIVTVSVGLALREAILKSK